MTPEAQRTAIAVACGWTDTQIIDGKYGQTDVPDYIHDLNAMHEAEKVLPAGQWDRYAQWLRELTSSNRRFLIARATASQRAEAFLRTIDKWKECK